MTDRHEKKMLWRRRKRASHTAAKVARGLVYVARDPKYKDLLPHGAADSVERLCLEAGVLKPWMCRLFESKWYRRFVDFTVQRFGPGELWRLTLRKRFVDEEVRDAISEGALQLLIVGTGFDTLGLRVARAFPDVTVVEVDTKSTVQQRADALKRMGMDCDNHQMVGADLALSSLDELLGSLACWQPEAKSVAVAEGVLMYLDEPEVVSFLREIKGSCGLGSRLIFSHLRADEKGRPYMGRLSGAVRTSLMLVGEPVRWGVRDGELEPFMKRSGFRLAGPPDRVDLGRRYLAPLGIEEAVGRIERFAIAEWS
jgi:methyltransferase (TIGR00027 family)